MSTTATSASSTPAPHATSQASKAPGILKRVREVWSLLGKQEKRLLRLSLLPMVLHSLAQIGILNFAGMLASRLQQSRDAGTMSSEWLSIAWRFALLIGALSLGREVFFLARKRMVSAVCSRVERNLTVGLVSHLFRQSLQSLSKEHVGAVHGRAIRGIASFVRFIRLLFRELFPVLISVAIAMGTGFIKSPFVGVLLVVALLMSFVLIAIQLKYQDGMFARMVQSRETLDGTVIEQLEGMEYIRAANTIGLEIERISKVADTRRSNDTKLSLYGATFDGIRSLNEWVFYLATLALTVYLAVSGQIEIGEIVTLLGIMNSMTSPLRDMHRILDDTFDTNTQLQDVMNIMDELLDPSFAIDPENEMTMLRRFGERRPAPPKVEFREPQIKHREPLFVSENLVVQFGTGEKQRRILNGVSVTIRHGEVIGMAGPSGSGKSTLLRAFMRLVPITSGEATFGGVPIENVSRDAIGRLVGYVSQNPFVFAGSVRDNIAYGCGDVTDKAIQTAAQKAGIHDEILAMPGGYDAAIQERGKNISGGQRQRLALARVFLKDPPILVLDEGTSALDNVGEHKVQQSLAALPEDRTVILVAHRLSTLRTADRILVFDQGQIVQVGSMNELVEQPGVFRELMKLSQAGG